jgi:hypothetical protein
VLGGYLWGPRSRRFHPHQTHPAAPVDYCRATAWWCQADVNPYPPYLLCNICSLFLRGAAPTPSAVAPSSHCQNLKSAYHSCARVLPSETFSGEYVLNVYSTLSMNNLLGSRSHLPTSAARLLLLVCRSRVLAPGCAPSTTLFVRPPWGGGEHHVNMALHTPGRRTSSPSSHCPKSRTSSEAGSASLQPLGGI